jgi:hypothetical protein
VKQALGFWQGATENHEICEEAPPPAVYHSQG